MQRSQGTLTTGRDIAGWCLIEKSGRTVQKWPEETTLVSQPCLVATSRVGETSASL